MDHKKEFFLEAYKLKIIKFGKFKLKSGIESPFYVDLRPLTSDPKILKRLANHLLNILPLDNFDLICGVPYAALPMATAMSLESCIPLITKRKEAKDYGTKKMIEGIYTKGQNCLLVEDVITSGKSLLETITEIENENLKISDILVVLDRQQGGKELLEEKGYNVHTLFTISEVVEILKEIEYLDDAEVSRIKNFIAGNTVIFEKEKRLSYQEKLSKTEHPVAKKLLEISIEKQSNLIASLDVTSTKELLDIADEVGPYVVAIKTHIDVINDFDQDKTILPLKDLAAKHNFMIMEDRKFADIGNTQELQFTSGVYKISHWADMITSHVIGGGKTLDCFRDVGVVSIVEMSSQGNLTDVHYREEALKLIQNHPNSIGCVAQNKVPKNLLLFTPGINLEEKRDNKGQQYNTPNIAFQKFHTDFVIVGRGIYKANDPEASAKKYKDVSWQAYVESLN